MPLLLASPPTGWWLQFDSPFVDGIGDSWQGSGHEGGDMGTGTGRPLYWMQQAHTGFTFTRHASGGTNLNHAAVTTMPQAAASGATAIILIAGGNDLAGGRTFDAMLADLDTINGLLAVGQHLFVSEVGPGNFNLPVRARLDTWNRVLLPAWCAANGATKLYINAELRNQNGTLRAEYDDDGLHMTQAGVQRLAELWWAGLAEFYNT